MRQIKLILFNPPVKRRRLLVALSVPTLVFLLATCGYSAFEGMNGISADFLLYGADSARFTSRNISLTRVERYGLPELAINGVEIGSPYHSKLYQLKWLTSGDQLYREHRITAGFGMIHSGLPLDISIRWYAAVEIYRLEIKRFGNTTGNGLSGAVDFNLPAGLRLNIIGDGVVFTGLDNGAIDQPVTARLFWELDPGTVLCGGMTYYPNPDQSTFSLAAENRFNRWITGRIAITDNPRRVGFSTVFTVRDVSVIIAVDHTEPLGWSRKMLFNFRW